MQGEQASFCMRPRAGVLNPHTYHSAFHIGGCPEQATERRMGCRRPILTATKYLVFRGQDTRMRTSLATKNNRRFEDCAKNRPPSTTSQERQPGELWRQDWLLALLLAIVTMVAYLPAWNGSPIWDDDAHLTKPELRSLDGLARIWTSTRRYPTI